MPSRTETTAVPARDWAARTFKRSSRQRRRRWQTLDSFSRLPDARELPERIAGVRSIWRVGSSSFPLARATCATGRRLKWLGERQRDTHELSL